MANQTRAGASPRKSDESVGILRWVFFRGRRTLTCEVRVHGEYSHDVWVVPHWDVAASIVERFDRPSSALRRHAEISTEFRQAGWATAHEPTLN